MSLQGLEVVLGIAEALLLSSADDDGSEDEANDEEKDNKNLTSFKCYIMKQLDKNYDDEADGEAARGGA